MVRRATAREKRNGILGNFSPKLDSAVTLSEMVMPQQTSYHRIRRSVHRAYEPCDQHRLQRPDRE
jgi:hypothetical protein